MEEAPLTYFSTKRYGHNQGFSCAFRQWRANSHCNLIHGYALSFELVFRAETLDDRNWVQDFGGLKKVKSVLETMFDHTTVVAFDDPEMEWFQEASKRGMIDLRVVESTGCEKFAELAYNLVVETLGLQDNPRVKLFSVQVWEHEGNSAIYTKD